MKLEYITGGIGTSYFALFQSQNGGEQLLHATSGLTHESVLTFVVPPNGYDLVGLCAGSPHLVNLESEKLSRDCPDVSDCFYWRIERSGIAGIPKDFELRKMIIDTILARSDVLGILAVASFAACL